MKDMSAPAHPPAAWYPNPSDSAQIRYWDGSQWTDHVAPAVAADPAAPEPRTVATASPPTAPVQAGDPASGQTRPPEPPERARGGLFGKKGLEAELEELRKFVDAFGYAERAALTAEIERLRTARRALATEKANAEVELTALSAQLVRAREESILQEVGVYDYHHRLEDAVAYKAELDRLRRRIREMSMKDGGAVLASTTWTVEGSAAKGRKMVSEFSKLLLRAYNGEADVLINKMRPYKLDAAVDQLAKARATISRLGGTMNITISDTYHAYRLEELRLTADFLKKKEEEKEAERAEKERLREEVRARKEFEAEKARLLKEQAHYIAALERIRVTGTPEEVAGAEQKLVEIGEAIHGVEEREANIRAGYVYVISNVGSFGPDVVKIGMTRRLEPMDRIRELGDASVPFRYDVHALVFSDDAVSLETRLHQGLADRRLNLVNLRREFFRATPAEVRALLTAADGSVLEFVETAIAEEWHQSVNACKPADDSAPPIPADPISAL